MSQQVNIYRKLEMGTSSRKIVNNNANINFAEFRCQSGATSGDNRGIYNRLYMTGAGGGGESLRSYTDVVGVACGTCHGAHISLGFTKTTVAGSITGLGAALRATLGIPDAAMPSGGTYAAIMPEIYASGANSSVTDVTQLSFIRCIVDGNTTGKANVDDKAYLLVVEGVEEGAGNMFQASNTVANYVTAARCLVNGVVKWLMFASAAG